MAQKNLPPTNLDDLPDPKDGPRDDAGRFQSPLRPHPWTEPKPKTEDPTPDVDATPQIPPQTDSPSQVSGFQIDQLRRLVTELAKRRVESLRIYEPLPAAEPFHQSLAPERVARGSNRASKTTVCAVEFARAITGQDPFGKYPLRDGRAYAVGKDGKHVGQVLYRKLFRAGAFKMIRDHQTGQWRAFRPWLAEDKLREKQAKPAPPLIPPRLVESIAWENKKEGIPNLVRLRTGWEINFYSSLAKPPQGSDIDLAWFDEEIVDDEWYPEISARLLDRGGRFMWSATPQAGTEQLYDLHQTAELEREQLNPRVVEFVFLLEDNPHITDEQKRQFAAKLSEEERRVRIQGEFALSSFRIYPEFSMITHGVDWFEIGPDWTRYMVTDPGRQVCGVLFIAVPPPQEGDHAYFYDELYIKNCDAEAYGREVAKKATGQIFQASLIDHHAGRQTEIAGGKTIEEQYSAALKRHGVASVATGHGFIWGADDPEAGIEAFRSWLCVREDGTTKLRVFREKLPNFEWEIRRYHYKRVNGLVTDKPNQKHNHLMDCARYIAMYGPKWVKPKVKAAEESYVLRALKKKRERVRERVGLGYVRLGPGR